MRNANSRIREFANEISLKALRKGEFASKPIVDGKRPKNVGDFGNNVQRFESGKGLVPANRNSAPPKFSPPPKSKPDFQGDY